MGDALLSFIQANQSVDYSFIIPLVIGYMGLFWIIVSVWVGYDATKRYKGKKLPALIGLGNLVFGVPFILLYLLFRPIDDDYSDSGSQGGVNVPIVNFLGKDGVAMSLELKINHNTLMPDNAAEMKIDVSFDSQDQNKSLVTPLITGETATNSLTAGAPKVSLLSTPVKSFWTKLKAKFPAPAPKKEGEVVTDAQKQERKKDKKKKKKKH